ncbi:MAG: hypothetical protein ACLGIB_05265 [Actinomycetota bacterium]
MSFTRRFACFALAVMATLALVTPFAHAQTPQGDNVALAQNTKDNSTIFDLSFNIRRVMAGSVDIDNAAVAVSSCDSCRTIALAIQVVLIFSDPDVVTTDNLALALNVGCTSCETMALAYQYVLTTGGPVHFTPEGQQAIKEILGEIRELSKDSDDMTLAEIHAAVDPLVQELYAVVDSELVPAGPPPSSKEESETVDEAEPTETPVTVTTPETSTSETPTTEASPSSTSEPTPTSTEPAASPTP